MLRKDIYDRMFDEFCIRNVRTIEEIDSWYPCGQFEIKILMSDGNKLIYNNLDKTVRNVTGHDEDDYIFDEDTCRKEFRYKLQEAMAVKGVNQKELSLRSGVSRLSISNILNGKQTPSIYLAYKLANSLGYSLHEFIHF